MKINGRRTHLGDRRRVGIVYHRTRMVVLAPRPSPEPDLMIIWYPHRDALSLLPPDAYGRADPEEVRTSP